MHNVFESIASRLSPILLDAGVKSLFILGLAAAAVLLLRRASAATRHFVWFIAVAGVLLLPALSLLLPEWRALPSWPATTFSAMRPTVAPAELSGDSTSARAPALPLATSVASVEQASVVAKPRSTLNHASLSVLIWFTGTTLALLVPVFGLISLWWLGHRSLKVTEGQTWQLLRQLAELLRFKRPIVLLGNPQRKMPMTWGVLRPKLLLPGEADQWAEERQRVVLLHELAHATRCDYLTNLITQIACALYWFNPLVWFAARQLAIERERACDDIVLCHGTRPADYAEQILQIASGIPAQRFAVHGGIAVARRSSLEGRLLAILDGRRDRRGLTRWATAVAIAGVVLAVCPIAVLRAADDKPDGKARETATPQTAPAAAPQQPRAEFSSLPEKPWTANGRVTDPQGQPIPGVEIWVHAGIGSLHRVATAVTDAEGRYTVPFGRGVWMPVDTPNSQIANVTAHKPGLFETNLNRHGARAAALREISAGELKSFGVNASEIFLPTQPQTIDFVMAPAARIKGRLLGTGKFPNLTPQQARKAPELIAGHAELRQSPLAGWRVWLVGKELPPACSVLASATTDDDGNFAFDSVPVGFEWQFQTETHLKQPEPKSPGFKLQSAASPFELEISLELPEKQNVIGFIAGVPGAGRQPAAEAAKVAASVEQRIKLRYAQEEFARATELRKQRLIGEDQYEKAKLDFELLEAEVRGDKAAMGRVKLRHAEAAFQRASELRRDNLISESEFNAARLNFELAKVAADQ